MHSLIPISTKVVYVTTRACANAVTTLRAEWDNTQPTLSLQRRNHLTIFGNVSWHRCNKWKVRKTINWSVERHRIVGVGQSWMDCDCSLSRPQFAILLYIQLFFILYSLYLLFLLLSLFFSPTEEMHKFIAEQLQTGRVPLCINPQSAAFKSFARWADELHNLVFQYVSFIIIILFPSISSSYKYYYFSIFYLCFCFESRNDIWN